VSQDAASERELWPLITSSVSQAAKQRFPSKPQDLYRIQFIALVYLWAALHDRSMNWACNRGNWVFARPPGPLPDQSTMSRRTRRKDFHLFLHAVGQALEDQAHCRPALLQLMKLDGKALIVASHSKDPDANFRWAGGRKVKGYKLHALWDRGILPNQWATTPMGTDEKQIARRVFKRMEGAGYALADSFYDANVLYQLAGHKNYQLLVPRVHPYAGLGHHRQDARRIRAIELLERGGLFTRHDFGPGLYKERKGIERSFGNISSFGGGLTVLPAWVRRHWRVRNWVHAKLLINAARILLRQRQRSPDPMTHREGLLA
jgi:hypothetical protein